MIEVSDKEFEQIVSKAIDGIPKRYLDRLENVAFIVEDEVNKEKRAQLGLGPHDMLFGLYEGAPLPMRQGQTKLLPDKITLYKKPLLAVSRNSTELKQQIKKTIWHEVAHYFGLGHGRINELEQKP